MDITILSGPDIMTAEQARKLAIKRTKQWVAKHSLGAIFDQIHVAAELGLIAVWVLVPKSCPVNLSLILHSLRVLGYKDSLVAPGQDDSEFTKIYVTW